MIWNVSTPKVCSTTRPTSCDSAPVSARVARASTSRCWRSSGLRQAGQLDVAARRLVAEEQRQDVERLQRRIRRELRLQPFGGAGHAHRHQVGLARHAHARFGLDVEERLDAGGVREIEAAAGHEISAALRTRPRRDRSPRGRTAAADRACRASSDRRWRRRAPDRCRCAASPARSAARRSARSRRPRPVLRRTAPAPRRRSAR